MTDIKQERISVGIHAAAAIAMGWLSVYLMGYGSKIYAGVLGIVLLIVIGFLVERITEKKGFKWWIGNGMIQYLLIWFVAWTFFLNV